MQDIRRLLSYLEDAKDRKRESRSEDELIEIWTEKLEGLERERGIARALALVKIDPRTAWEQTSQLEFKTTKAFILAGLAHRSFDWFKRELRWPGSSNYGSFLYPFVPEGLQTDRDVILACIERKGPKFLMPESLRDSDLMSR